jgi:hypothetical protein
MEEASQKFDDVVWTEVMAQVEKTYVLLTEQQVELEKRVMFYYVNPSFAMFGFSISNVVRIPVLLMSASI